MTTTEVVKLLAKRMKLNQKTARSRLRSLLDLLAALIIAKKELRIPEMGTILVKEYKPRNCYIPGKGYCRVPERIRAVFKTSNKFKNWVLGKKENHES